MTLGSMMLIDVSQAPETLQAISLKVILPVVLFTAAFIIFALTYVIRAHRRQPTTGAEGLVGLTGTAISEINPIGTVQVHGEYWKATARLPIPRGASITVLAVENMVLHVTQKE